MTLSRYNVTTVNQVYKKHIFVFPKYICLDLPCLWRCFEVSSGWMTHVTTSLIFFGFGRRFNNPCFILYHCAVENVLSDRRQHAGWTRKFFRTSFMIVYEVSWFAVSTISCPGRRCVQHPARLPGSRAMSFSLRVLASLLRTSAGHAYLESPDRCWSSSSLLP